VGFRFTLILLRQRRRVPSLEKWGKRLAFSLHYIYAKYESVCLTQLQNEKWQIIGVCPSRPDFCTAPYCRSEPTAQCL